MSILSQKLRWFSKPRPEHLVQFYPSDSVLLPSLTTYVHAGLTRGDTCIVVATKAHLRELHTRLEKKGLDITAAKQNGQYIARDADLILGEVMVDGLPDRTRFFEIIGGIVEKARQKGAPIRAYGEMVALLWKDGNKEGVIEVERLWNELVANYSFSLYCAYPELHFILDKEAVEEIRNCHHVNLQRVTA